MYLIFLAIITIAAVIYLVARRGMVQKISDASTEHADTAIRRFDKKALVITLVVIAVVAVVCIVASIDKPVNFKEDFSKYQYNSWCDIADDNSYLRIDTNPSDRNDFYYTEAADAIQDINRALGFSSALYRKMLETRALDGRQYDENDRVKVSWTYHPDKGLVVTYEKKS